MGIHSTGHKWIPFTEGRQYWTGILLLLTWMSCWEHRVRLSVIWVAMTFMQSHCNIDIHEEMTSIRPWPEVTEFFLFRDKHGGVYKVGLLILGFWPYVARSYQYGWEFTRAAKCIREGWYGTEDLHCIIIVVN